MMEGGGLDLPDWNTQINSQEFTCSPPKHPLAQATLKDGNTQRVTALGSWKAAPAAAAAAAAVLKPAFPAAPAPLAAVARSLSDAENDASGELLGDGAAPAPEPPRSVRRTHTPSRTGLTARPVRMPSRLGLTPGAKAGELFEVPATARRAAGAAPPTGKNLKSILKRLNFSATKAKVAATVAAHPAAPGTGAPATAQVSYTHQPQAAAGAAAQSTIKQLRFDAGATPTAVTAKPGARHVSFDAATVSPVVRGGRPGAVMGSTGPSHMRTPEPAIQEESSGEEGGPSTVNSAAAGHTPYDRRLSSLFRKYQVAGTPELTDAELDELVAEGAVQSPSWKRLSPASVPESIRELATKYSSDPDRRLGRTPPDASASPLPAAEAMELEAATPVPAGGAGAEGSSPALEPTPHAVLDSVMKVNALYNTSPAEPPAAVAAAPLSPSSAVAQLLAPVLLATINEIDGGKEKTQQQTQQGSPSPAASGAVPSPAYSSPADFYGFPLGATQQEAATPGSAAAAPRSASMDGVPRDASGIPVVTPATVTVRRGSVGGGLGMVLEEDGDLLAANLFGDSFSPLGDGARSFSPTSAGGSPAMGAGGFGSPTVGEEAEPAHAQQQQQGEQARGAANTPATAGTAEFSFFPSAGAGGSRQVAAAAGVTPELHSAAAAAADGYISPEILGFYEQEAQRQAGADGSQAGGAAGTVLPKSIIKSGRPLTEAGTPVLGHAQRAPAGEAPPHTITKELQALMSDLRLGDPAELEQMGTVSTLSPVRATGAMRGFLGGLARAITPVRRSARKKAPGRPLEAMLEETGFSYVPNAAMMSDAAAPKQEAAQARAAKRAATLASSQAGEATLADMPGTAAAAGGQPEVSSTAPLSARRYSTRSAAQAEVAEEEAEEQEQDAPATTTAATMGIAATPEAAPGAGRRMSLRRLRTPMHMAHLTAEEEGASTPAATLAGAGDVPVAQDASPQLAESPSCMAAAAAAAAGSSAYRLRPSTVLKTRQSVGTPLPAAAAAAAAGEASSKKGRRGGPQLSPTEQGIRASLRRSARKSQGGAAGSQ